VSALDIRHDPTGALHEEGAATLRANFRRPPLQLAYRRPRRGAL